MNKVIFTFIFLTSAWPQMSSATESSHWRQRLVAACTTMLRKNTPHVKKTAPYCNCAAQAHLKPKDVTEAHVEWLEKLYTQKLSEDEIQADPYGLADFELDVELQCRRLRK